VSVETGEAIKHCFLGGISRDGMEHRYLFPGCFHPEYVPVKDQRLINSAAR